MLGGAIVSAIALVLVGLVLPAAQHWVARNAAYAASREQWARLDALTANADRLRGALTEQRVVLAGDENRLVTGATPALAASTLQGLLQRYAEEAAVQLDRVDVAGEPRPDRLGLVAIPVQLQARGDVRGLVDFLYRLEHGTKLLVVDELTLNGGFDGVVGPAAATVQTLSWTLRVHGLYGPHQPSEAGGS
ncbi:MAG TPA: type II secretion system protein GspM [Gemmatimonadales bacterium]|nr:type II secretion system protein GspM [Gemmatimonadales bacterium]